jgi:5'-3' exonuclease
MQVHLVDGTYELFRSFYGAPEKTAPGGREVGATLALGRTLLSLLGNEGATHAGVAFDHVIESFRNGLFAGYKTGQGIDPALLAQFEPAERMTRALGLVVWPMIEFEADDVLATAAARYRRDRRVERVLICSPDKDLAQCVRGQRVVLVDRRRKKTIDEGAVVEKYGVRPASIPDWLALVGDAADGIPGIPRWGTRSSAAALRACGHIEGIPDDPAKWKFEVRGAAGLAESLRTRRDELALYRTLATLREDVPLTEAIEDLEWRGARRPELETLCRELGDDRLPGSVTRWLEPPAGAAR